MECVVLYEWSDQNREMSGVLTDSDHQFGNMVFLIVARSHDLLYG